jgi:hypothetical protein
MKHTSKNKSKDNVGTSHIEGGIEYGTSFASFIENQKP